MRFSSFVCAGVTTGLMLCVGITGCSQAPSASAPASAPAPKSAPAAAPAPQNATGPVYLNTHYSFRERAADLVSRMTLAEEVGQLHTNSAPAIPRLGVQEYTYWSEGQHGVNRINNLNGPVNNVHATSFPTNFAAAMTWDPALMHREANAISSEARGFLDTSLWGKSQNDLGTSPRDYGFLTYWAPTINMDRDPRWGRTDEAFGEDTYLASQMAGAFVNGYQGQTADGTSKTGYLKAAATAKHFVLNDVENNRTGLSSDATDADIRDYYTAVFRHLMEKAHVAGLMTSYNAINGTPAVADTYTVNELAQRTFGFDGYITSDCGAVGTTYESFPKTLKQSANGHGGHDWAPPGWTTQRHKTKGQPDTVTWTNTSSGTKVSGAAGGQAFALRAGTALNCVGPEATVANIRQAINAGILSKGVIDRDLTRVFAVRMATGEFDPPAKVPYTHITKSVIQSKAHQELAEKVAENAVVLLKNAPVSGSNAPLLPIDAAKLKKVVVVGNLAQKVILGGYSGDPATQISPLQGIAHAVMTANPHASVIFDATDNSPTATTPASLSAKARADIKSADLVIVFVGTDLDVAREGHDRANLAMPGNDHSLIEQVAAQGNRKMALLIQAPGPVKVSDVQKDFAAIVFSGYNGETQGEALANVLTGKKNPSGHLDFTWYKDTAQLPKKSDYGLTPKATGGLGRTYMYFTGTPSYPFGFGLSYSRFTYSHVQVSATHASPNDSVKVSFDVTNSGQVPGATVAQVYVASPKVAGETLPVKRLRGFEKTRVLKPGATQHIVLPLKLASLALWNEAKLEDVVYNGTYRVQVGTDSQHIVASRKLDVQGTLTRKIAHVTIQPGKLVYHVGDTLNLHGKNTWIKNDTKPSREQRHAVADNIVEAVYNNGAFANLDKARVHYASSDHDVATVDDNGVVKAVGHGVVEIKATVDGVSGSTVIVVK